jgi:hypothetical protein
MGQTFRFGIERVYSKGPMARLKCAREVVEKPEGGTHLIYEMWSTPRNLPGALRSRASQISSSRAVSRFDSKV